MQQSTRPACVCTVQEGGAPLLPCRTGTGRFWLLFVTTDDRRTDSQNTCWAPGSEPPHHCTRVTPWIHGEMRCQVGASARVSTTCTLGDGPSVGKTPRWARFAAGVCHIPPMTHLPQSSLPYVCRIHQSLLDLRPCTVSQLFLETECKATTWLERKWGGGCTEHCDYMPYENHSVKRRLKTEVE